MFLCKRHIDIPCAIWCSKNCFLSIVTTIIAFLVSYEIMYYFVKRLYQINTFTSNIIYYSYVPYSQNNTFIFLFTLYSCI